METAKTRVAMAETIMANLAVAVNQNYHKQKKMLFVTKLKKLY